MPKFSIERRDAKLNHYIFRKKGKGLVATPTKFHWNVEGSTLKVVNSRLRRRLVRYVDELKTKKAKPVVFEWGCGDATALFEIAKNNPEVSFIGTSDQSHPNWRNKPKNVTLLHTTSEGIERLANLKSSSKKVDLAYSHFGIRHLLDGVKTNREATKILVNHFKKLKNSLNIGGRIIIRPLEFKIAESEFRILVNSIKKLGYQVEITTGLKGEVLGISELTRVK